MPNVKCRSYSRGHQQPWNSEEPRCAKQLADPLPGATLFDLGGLQVELEDLLGVPVDLLTPGDLPAKFRAEVLEQARPA